MDFLQTPRKMFSLICTIKKIYFEALKGPKVVQLPNLIVVQLPNLIIIIPVCISILQRLLYFGHGLDEYQILS